ncbi:MAG TPA: hypothetical protein VM491_18890 [Burkholderiaceae bacterium]|jgi:uncharacterized protein|nr:hypothetical protein [Burkholderiaceae bacterium]
MRVAALYRYPLKGFTSEPCETLTILPNGRPVGDRVLGLRLATATAADDAWGTKTSRYQDDECGFTTLHSRESVKSVGAAAGQPQIDECRFGSNIAIEGAAASDEQHSIGRRIRIGEVEFEAVAAKGRCLATHVNPATRSCDLPVMRMLLRAFPADRPVFAIALRARGSGGRIRLGETVTVIER